MQHPDEGTIHAWIDGELSADDASSLEAHLTECQECSALAAEARGLVAASSRIISALDIVPGGVIPRVAARQPWYMSTQLRAAAAVVIVAGASMLVMRNSGELKTGRAMRERAPAETAAAAPALIGAGTELDQAATQAAPAPIVAETPPKPAPTKALEGKVSRARVSDLRKETANDAATIVAQAPPPAQSAIAGAAAADEITAAKPRAKLDSSFRDSAAQRRRFLSTSTLNEVVVTGVATSTTPTEFKKIRVDSAKNETVYQVSPGVEVTLSDNGRPANIMLRSSTAQSKEKQMTATVPAPAPPPPTAAPSAPAARTSINFITWTDKRGHVMVLRGALSKEQLEALRQRLPEDQR